MRGQPLALATLIVLGLAPAGMSTAADDVFTYYVATNGSDAWTGLAPQPNVAGTDGPFATVDRARRAVLALKQRPGGLTKPVEVLIRGGTYYLSSPLRFYQSDSGSEACPIRYKAYPGETPVLSGGRAMNNWSLYSGDIYRCSVAGLSLTGCPIRQLFHKRRPQQLARYPNYDPANPIRGGYMFTEQPKSNRGVIQWVCRPPDWVEYRVDVPAAGAYYIWTYYAGHPGTAAVSVTVDGGASQGTQSLPTTDYLTYAWSPRGIPIGLPAGVHTIRFTSVSSHNGFYPDAWVFCDSADYSPVSGSAPAGAHVLRIEAEHFAQKASVPISMDDARETIEIGYNPAPDVPEYHNSAALPVVRSTWSSAPEAEFVVFMPDQMDWLTNVVGIASADAAGGRITFDQSTLTSFTAGRRCYVRNVFEELDAPGEWYLDKATSTLYFWPPDGKKPANGDVVIGYLDRVLQLQGSSSARVRYLEFSGITFRDTTARELGGVEFPADGAVRLDQAENCRFEGCRMVDLAANAVTLDVSCRSITITGCEIRGAGACGILQPPTAGLSGAILTGHHIYGNDIHHVAQLHKGTGAIELYYGGNIVEHNYCHDLPRWGIVLPFVQGGQNIVRYNEIRRSCLETADCGPIHVSPHTGDGGEIDHNLIIDAPGLATGPSGAFRSPYSSWAIYIDCRAPGYYIHDNIVAGTFGGGFVIEGPRNIFENNIIYDAAFYQGIPNYAAGITADCAVRRNVFSYASPAATLHRLATDAATLLSGIRFDYNLIYHAGGPVAMSNGLTFQQWQAAGGDAHSVVADPLFQDPEQEDFTFRPGSPALALGIHSVDLSNAGLRGYPARTFHVSPKGDDANDGRSPATAWATFERGDRDGMLLPGDTVLVAAGTYAVSRPIEVCAGTAAKPIIYKADGKVVLNPANGAPHALQIKKPARHVVLDGFTIQGGQSPLGLTETIGNRIMNCSISDRTAGVSAPLVHLSSSGSNWLHNCTIGPAAALGASGIVDENSTGGDRFHNNTIADVTDWGVSVLGGSGAQGMEFRNNIIAKAAGGIRTDNPLLAHSHNILYRITQTLYSGTSPGQQERTWSPIFFDAANRDYRLRTGSPAIDAGVDVGLPYLGVGPDIGALEYTAPLDSDTSSDLKDVADGSFVRLLSSVVSAVFANDVIYVEDSSRSAGIRVVSSPSLPAVLEGQVVTVEGMLTTVSGERAIRAMAIDVM